MVCIISLNANVIFHSDQPHRVQDGAAHSLWKVEQTNYYKYTLQLDRSRFLNEKNAKRLLLKDIAVISVRRRKHFAAGGQSKHIDLDHNFLTLHFFMLHMTLS